jgi:hypothetical protein
VPKVWPGSMTGACCASTAIFDCSSIDFFSS